MLSEKSLSELRKNRYWLMGEIDSVERGETVCIERVYIKLLTRLYMVDLEIRRREYAESLLVNRSGALTGISSLPEVGRRDK